MGVLGRSRDGELLAPPGRHDPASCDKHYPARDRECASTSRLDAGGRWCAERACAGAASPPALDISGLPVFTIWCTSGPLAGQIAEVTDPGRALITGKCADIGKLKGPILRGLAARAPYFHNGSAATLADVVEFYNQRFDIGFTDQQKADLAAFLSAL
jgi:hypothetical protein